jgi:hypothetical protein
MRKFIYTEKTVSSIALSLLNSGCFSVGFRGHINKFSVLSFTGNAILHKGSIVFLNSSLDSSFLVKQIVSAVFQEYLGFYSSYNKLYMVGLGYKNFILGNHLYILVGDCNYIIFAIPDTIKVFCKKNQLYFLARDKSEISNFMHNIKTIKKLNFYKGKGVLLFKNFKFTKLKVGKKQRFA